MAQRDAKLTVGAVSKALLWLVYAWVLVDLALLILAFALRLLGANPEAGFADWVYRSVDRSMAPFRGLFEPIALTDQSLLDASLLFAMIVYGLVALLLRAGIDWVAQSIVQRRRRLDDRGWRARQEAEMAAATAQAGHAGAPTGFAAAPSGTVTPPSLEALRRDRAEILTIGARWGASNVRVFGSVARGDETVGSDLNLLVDMEPGRGASEVGWLRGELQDFLGCSVDVRDLTGFRSLARDRILADAVSL